MRNIFKSLLNYKGTVNQNITVNKNQPVSLVTGLVNDELRQLIQARFINDFDTKNRAIILAGKLITGDFAACENKSKSVALAWCVRLLSYEDLDKARDIYAKVKELGTIDELLIAEAFLESANQNKSEALAKLATIDSPQSKSASLLIVNYHSNSSEAINWVDAAGLSFEDFDHDGQIQFMNFLCHENKWDEAFKCLDRLLDQSYVNAPVLHYFAAGLHLSKIVPSECRLTHFLSYMFSSVTLHEDTASMEHRSRAIYHLQEYSRFAKENGCPATGNVAYDCSLWVMFTSGEESKSEAIKKVRERLSNPEHRLRVAPLAVYFGLEIDKKQLNLEIKQTIVRSGGATPEIALTQFYLALQSSDPIKIATSITEHRDMFYHFLNKHYVNCYEIESLAKSGELTKAQERFETVKEGSTADEIKFLQEIIGNYDSPNDLEYLRLNYKNNQSTYNLRKLAKALEDANEWSESVDYRELLFGLSKTIESAEDLASTFINAKQYDRLNLFLKESPEFLAKSPLIHLIKCEMLFSQGYLNELKDELKSLCDSDYLFEKLKLEVRCAIYSGDWDSLSKAIEAVWEKREILNSESLLSIAKLSKGFNTGRAMELIKLAVEREGNDCDILINAYNLATELGNEDSEEVFSWITKAMELSGNDGPIKRFTLEELVEKNSAWNESKNKVLEEYYNGNIGIWHYSKQINLPLVQLILSSSMFNEVEPDLRVKSTIPAFTGVQRNITGIEAVKKVGIGPTGLMTLAHMDLLDEFISAFDQVVVPHSIMNWLFGEMNKATYHQPSIIEKAKEVQMLVSQGVLTVCPAEFSFELSCEVGAELASLLEVAKESNLSPGQQHIVVKSAPVYQASSLMKEEVNLSEFEGELINPLDVIEKLNDEGRIDSRRYSQCESFLKRDFKPWTVINKLSESSTIYLDHITLGKFQHIDIIQDIVNSGYSICISKKSIDDANQLVKYECQSELVKEKIETLRTALQKGISAGKVKLDEIPARQHLNEYGIDDSPSLSTLLLSRKLDVVFIDDRFMATVDQNNILNSLELLDILNEKKLISKTHLFELRAKLRNSGYQFVPLTEEELTHSLNKSSLNVDGTLRESFELIAIRKQLQKAKMSNFFPMPQNVHILLNLYQVFKEAHINIWKNGTNIKKSVANSTWVFNQFDLRGWANSYSYEESLNFISTWSKARMLTFLQIPLNLNDAVKSAYIAWGSEFLLPTIQPNKKLYAELIDYYKNEIREVSESFMLKGDL